MSYIRIAGALIAALALAAFGWKAYHMGMTAVQIEWNAANLKAEETARSVEQQRTQAVQKAQNEHTKQIQTVRRDAATARTELDGLRNEIGRSNNASDQPLATADKRADTLGELLGQCGSAYQELAFKADGHVADVRLLLGAWPK